MGDTMRDDIYVGRNAAGERVYVSAEVRHADDPEKTELSLSGVVIRKGGSITRGGDWQEAGQISTDHLRAGTETAPGFTRADLRRLADVWDRWHLNALKAGCEHQRAAGWDKRPIDPDKPTDTYGLYYAGQHQPSWNLLGWVRPSEHPEGLMTRPCPECGYRYGTAWLHEPLPADVAAFVLRLFPASAA